MSAVNYYEVLGIAHNASDQEIKEAYRREAMKWHPDRHDSATGKAEAERRFKMLAEAYRVLRDAAMRAEYDEGLRRDSANERYEDAFNDGGNKQADRKNTSSDQAADGSKESADAIFFEQMLDLAFDLASRGFAAEKITSALTSLGCPESMAKAVANIAAKRNGGAKTTKAQEASKAPPGHQSAGKSHHRQSQAEWKLDYYKAITDERFRNYYLRTFKAFDDQPGKLLTLPNIGALFFQYIWLAYKGMWKYMAIYVILWIPISAIALNSVFIDYFWIAGLVVGTAFSLVANAIYHRHANKMINRALEKYPEKHDQLYLLRRNSQKSDRIFLAILAAAIIIPISLAVALPAIDDHLARHKVNSGLIRAQEASQNVDSYLLRNKLPPQSIKEAGYIPPATDGVESVEYNESLDIIEVKFNESLAHASLLLVRVVTQGSSNWLCGSETLKPAHLPTWCKSTQEAALRALAVNTQAAKNFSARLQTIFQKYPELNDQGTSFSEANLKWFEQKYFEYVITGKSKIDALNAAISDYERATQQAQTRPPSAAKRISLNFINSDIRAIFGAIADTGKVNFIFDDLVQFNTTIRIDDEPWDTAVGKLLRRYSLSFIEGQNGYYIYPSDMRQDIARQRAAARGLR